MYTCNGQGWMCVDNSSSVFHASTHPSCGGGGFISGTLQWATHGCLSNCCQTGSLSILRKSLMCTETFLWNYGLKTLCETCGGVNLVEHCLFKATVTETVTPKVKDPTRYVMWKNSSNFIWKRNASKKCSSAFIKCYWGLDFFSHLEKLIWCLCVCTHRCVHTGWACSLCCTPNVRELCTGQCCFSRECPVWAIRGPGVAGILPAPSKEAHTTRVGQQ